MRFVRDGDGDLYIEIPGKPGWFAMAADFQRGKKYVEQYQYSEGEVAAEDGPLTVEWEIEERVVPAPSFLFGADAHGPAHEPVNKIDGCAWPLVQCKGHLR